MKEPKTIKIDEIEYVRKDSLPVLASKLEGMKYVVVRTYSAGCFAGYLESQKKQEVVLRDARRLWYWSGASSLSQLAMEGVKDPDECKFPCVVHTIKLLEAIEIIDATEEAKESIDNVVIWKQ